MKKSKFIGSGNINKKEIENLKKQFEEEIIVNKKYEYLTKQQIKEIENFKETYNKKIDGLKKEEYEQFQKS